MTTSETISGVVEARNERGIRVAGEWRNLSKFHPLELPDVGAQVALGLDPKGFLTSIEVVGELRVAVTHNSRDRTITRLSVLKSAAMFLGQMSQTREEVRSEHVLKLAERWLEWVES